MYFDEIIVNANDTTQHLERLRRVLAGLQKAYLKIKTSKCKFNETELVTLGHLIEAQGIRLDPEKIWAMQDFPKPAEVVSRVEKVRFVRSFVVLCSYYRSFISGFAQIAKPLADLTKEKSLFYWDLIQ